MIILFEKQMEETLLHTLRWISRKFYEEFEYKIWFLWWLFGIYILFSGNALRGDEIPERLISTKFGIYSIKITSPALPRLKMVQLFEMTPSKFPKLLNWPESAESPGFSLLSTDTDLYQEGLTLYNKGSFRNSLEEFDELILEYPQSQFYQASLFWKAQILLKLKKYKAAQGVLLEIISSGQYSNYLFQSAHTHIWLTIQQGSIQQALTYIDQYSRSIFTPQALEKVLPLKVYAHLKQNQLVAGLETLLQLQKQFPENSRYFENAVKIAELYHQLKQWEQINPLIEEVQEKFRDHALMEKLLFIGVSGDLQLKSWKTGQQKLDLIHQRETKERNRFTQSYFYFHLWQNQFKQAHHWLEQFSTEKLRNFNLRQLLHRAFEQRQFRFLADSSFNENLMTGFAREAHWILGHAQEELDQSEQAYQEYQKALSFAQTPDLKEQLSFNLVAVELKLRNYDKAAARLNQMLVDYRQSPKKPDYVFWYGVAQDQLGAKIALPYLKQVKPPSEKADDSLFYLERYYHAKKNWNQANAYFLKLIKEYPETPFLLWAYYYRAEGLFQNQQYEEAQHLLKEWRKDHQTVVLPIELTELWSRILMALQRFEEAKELLEQVKIKDSHFNLAQLYIQVLAELKEHENIIQFITTSLKQSWSKKQKESLYFRRAESAFALKLNKDAIRYYQEILEHHVQTDHRYIYHQLAKLAHETERYPQFIKMSLKVLEGPQDKISNNVLILLSDYYLRLKNKKQERFYLQKLAKNYETKISDGPLTKSAEASLTFELAKVKNKLGLFQEAGQLLDRTIVLEGSQVSLEVFREKGNADFQNKQYEKAAASYLKVVYLNPNPKSKEQFDLLDKIAYSFEKIEQFKEAKAIYQKMLKEYQEETLQEQVKKNLQRLEIVSRETKE